MRNLPDSQRFDTLKSCSRVEPNPEQEGACMRPLFAAALCLASFPAFPFGQQAPSGAAATTLPEPKNWTAAEDHQNMMDQLGIKALRPGPSGNESDPRHANYD